VVPDYASVGVGFNGIAGVGATNSFDFNWTLRGPDASWKPSLSTSPGTGGGYSLSATINITGTNYLGAVNDIKRNFLITNTARGDKPSIWFAPAVSAGPKLGLTFGYSFPGNTGYGLVSRQLNTGGGLPAGPLPGNASGGVSNTLIIYDFYKP
jgi:hypothetical protein